MKKIILSEEFKRIQKLAGIQINEDAQEVILYATDEIIAKKVGFQDEGMGSQGEWSSF